MFEYLSLITTLVVISNNDYNKFDLYIHIQSVILIFTFVVV